MEALINGLISLLGVAIIVWWNAVRSPKFDKFNFEFWYKNNLEAIGLTFMGILLMSILAVANEGSIELVHTTIGLDLVNTKSGWFLFGVSLYELIRKTKIKNKEDGTTDSTGA